MRPVKILCICGTGVAGANIIMYKLREAFEAAGLPVHLTTASNTQVAGMVHSGQADMIVATSLYLNFEDVPYFHATAFYTGEGEQELLEDIIAAARKIIQEQTEEDD
jgi:PTS system galactitol-specific IIB component